MSANKKFKPVIVEAPQSHAAIRGRGASWSPANRFEKLHVDLTDPDVVDVGCETEETAAAPDAVFSRRNENDYHPEYQSGCRL